MAFDISGLTKNMGVALEQGAYRQFGAVVENKIDGALASIFANGGVSQTASSTGPQIGAKGDWNIAKYAAGLGPAGFDPKIKFLFRVSFEFSDAALAEARKIPGINVDEHILRKFPYVVRDITLPKYTMEYEDVNMYNFRTKVLKSINHEEMQLTLYDDVSNSAQSLLILYLKLLKPNFRREWTADQPLENFGFAFDDDLNGGLDSGKRAALQATATDSGKNVLRSLRIDQFYLDRFHKGENEAVRGAIYANSFKFTNPRLASFDFGSQDYSNGTDPNTISCSIDYDALYVETHTPGVSVRNDDESVPDILGNNGKYEGFSSTSLPPGPGVSSNSAGHKSPTFGSKLGAMVNNTVGAFAGQMVRGTVDDLARKAGVGPSSFGGALAGANSALAGGLGTNAERTLKSIGSGIASGISIKSPPKVKDNSSGGK